MTKWAVLVGVAGLAAAANADVIISEIVDGDLSGGNPKFVELYNAGGAPVTFGPNDFVKGYFNGGTTANTTVSLDGVTIAPGQAFVIASTGNAGDLQFQIAYGFDADMYTSAFFGNGDDAFTLEIGGVIVDMYGVVGVDGSGLAWDYTDSYGFRNATVGSASSTFVESEWTFGGVAALDAPDDATRIQLLQQYTTPGTHVPTPGSLALLAVGGLAAARRRR